MHGFPSHADYLAAMYPTDADRREAEGNAQEYARRIPERDVETLLAVAHLTPRTLVETDDGQKGWISGWTYDGCWQPVLDVVLFMPRDPAQPRAWYYLDQVEPVWHKPGRITLTRAVMTSEGCPSQWDAWDADGNRFYLRYRWGVGTLRVGSPAGAVVAEFDTGDALDGLITLVEFAEEMGIEVPA